MNEYFYSRFHLIEPSFSSCKIEMENELRRCCFFCLFSNGPSVARPCLLDFSSFCGLSHRLSSQQATHGFSRTFQPVDAYQSHLRSIATTKMKSKYAAIKKKGGGRKHDGNKSCSLVMTISWMIILAWLIFLFYCYRSGQLQTAKLPASYVNRISSMLDRVDHSLRGATHDLVHLYPPPTNTAPEATSTVKAASATPPQSTAKLPISPVPNVIPPPVSTVKVIVPPAPPKVDTQKIQLPITFAPVVPVPAAVSDIVHVIFSTDCTPYQDYQTIVLFHSAMVVGQKGPVTRIASGCDEKKKKELTELYHKLYPQYHVHYTPDFKKDDKTGHSCTCFHA